MVWSAIAWLLTGMILICLLIAIGTDLANRIIPNRIVLAVLCLSFGLRLAAGPSLLLASLLAAVAVLAMLSLLARYDLIGWGDVKLIAAVTFVVPADRVILLLLAIVMAGGLLSCAYLAARFVLRRAAPLPRQADRDDSDAWAIRRLVQREGARILANEPIPYALAIFGGVVYGLTTE
jgi:prepilin peptidase CpaA